MTNCVRLLAWGSRTENKDLRTSTTREHQVLVRKETPHTPSTPLRFEKTRLCCNYLRDYSRQSNHRYEAPLNVTASGRWWRSHSAMKLQRRPRLLGKLIGYTKVRWPLILRNTDKHISERDSAAPAFYPSAVFPKALLRLADAHSLFTFCLSEAYSMIMPITLLCCAEKISLHACSPCVSERRWFKVHVLNILYMSSRHLQQAWTTWWDSLRCLY